MIILLAQVLSPTVRTNRQAPIRNNDPNPIFICKLRSVDYTHLGTGAKEHGFIAQEVAKTGFFGYTAEGNDSHWLASLLFIAPIVKALQEVDQRLAQLY